MPDPSTTQGAGRLLSNARIDEIAVHIHETGKVPAGGLQEVMGHCDALPPEQVERIGAKQQWERRGRLAVLADWPSLFYAEEASHAD